jgi:superfamily II DNA/RNA helicase
MVFVATRYACDHVADKLRRAGLTAEAFHGDASQGARTRLLAAFKAGELQVLVATDLGARGIDIAQLPVVVNYDLPRAAADYVHRIGRTARRRQRPGHQLHQPGHRGALPPDRKAPGPARAARAHRRLRRDRDRPGRRRHRRHQGQAAEQEGQAAGGAAARH